MASRRAVTLMPTVDEFLGGATRTGAGSWAFNFGPELHGAFGGVFGGALAAAAVLVGRELAPGRAPAGLDIRFLRALPAGPATAKVTTVHHGRRLSVVDVELADARGRPVTRATVSLVDPGALHPVESDHVEPGTRSAAQAWEPQPGLEIPIIETLRPTLSGTAVHVRVPWEDGGEHGAEAVCLAADLSVGPPVAAALDRWRPHPNPDLALRFGAGLDGLVAVSAEAEVATIAGGLAAVGLRVRSDTRAIPAAVLAVGVASSLVLGG